jgi:hypothetical protein
MKSIYIAVALAAGLGVGVTGATLAAAPTTAPAAGAIAVVTLSPADATTFKTWIGTQKTAKVVVPAGLNVAVGTVLPANITLVDIPATAKVASITKYKYVLLGDKTVLVDPMTRKIVYIVS